MTHWRTKVLADPADQVQIVVADGEVAGSFMAWWRDDRRFIGYWVGQRFWGRGIGTNPHRQLGNVQRSGSWRWWLPGRVRSRVAPGARTAGTPQHQALVRLVGTDVASSEAATLHALVAFGLTALGEQIALDDYEQFAASRDDDDAQYEQTMRRRVRDP